MKRTTELNWAMSAHLSALCLYFGLLFFNLLVPYLIWRWKKKQSDYVAMHALAALNAQITISSVALAAWLIAIIFPVAWAVVIAVLTANIVFIGKAADRAKSGQSFRYPYAIQWLH